MPHSSKEIRESWINFFSERGHKHVSSSSLIPDNPTLLLTSAGMVQFVPYFLGLKEPAFKRAVTIQKCARAGGKDSDLENIGRTTRHHSFFEMLGNFSFGDYFKKEAITWAWDYVTKTLELPKDKLIVSVFEGDTDTPPDEEAYNIWKKEIGLSDGKIRKLPRKEVFWGPPGPTGPCGPCSEIYFDRGDGFKDHDERFLEIWNLVFMELEKDEDGKFKPLIKKNIDTGAGLERIALLLQNKPNTFETDLLRPILDSVSEVTKTKYIGQEARDKGQQVLNSDLSLKIITDHLRCITFLIADGVRPSNIGRGYVLRMLTRRAARFGWLLGTKEPFLYKLPKIVSDNYSFVYPEISKNLNVIIETIQKEEERFAETIEKGLIYLDEVIANSGKTISGEKAFDLYSTYGFPVELTLDIAKEKNKDIDMKSFEKAKEKHSEVSGGEMFDVKLTTGKHYGELLKEFGETRFLGYTQETCKSKVLALINQNREIVNELKESETGELILDQTVFYAESGGQVGDTGKIIAENKAFEVIVTDTQKQEGLFVHHIKVTKGSIKHNTTVNCELDRAKRNRTKHHHSVTHLMHSALRKVFDESLQQAGSEVNHERTRFDFTLDRGVTDEEKRNIEDMVNNWIKKALPVEAKEMTFNEAMQTGALAFFGDKYGDIVRVLKMGNEKDLASVELCGGTHVQNTSEIGGFKIIKENSIAAGTRRIEAIAGEVLKEYIKELNEKHERLKIELLGKDKNLKASFKQYGLEDKWEELTKEYGNLATDGLTPAIQEKYKKANNILTKKFATIYTDSLKLKESATEKLSNGISLFCIELDDFPDDVVRTFIEGKLKSEKAYVTIIANITEDNKLKFTAGVSKDLTAKGINAKDLVNKVAEVTGGKGGGKDNFAQAGGRDITKVKEALKTGRELISKN
ncbi:MAG: alanine--tRNA ligase [Candidatus Melainabacteria bacterium]|nr:alanine--tRNA ligase [Candidatus Melainabacteria bacterium]